MTKGVVNESYSSFEGKLSKSMLFSAMKAQIPDNQLQPGMSELSAQLGIVPNFNQTTGLHLI
jgi:hypothetical protein